MRSIKYSKSLKMVSLKDYKNNLPPLKNICNEAKGYAETYYRMIKKVQITNNLF
jgi:hypothetical protein